MAELYHGHRLYFDDEDEQRLSPVSFPFDAILDIRASKGSRKLFDYEGPMTYVRLTHERGMWLTVKISVFRAAWERYLQDEPEMDEFCDCPDCQAKASSFPNISLN